MPRAIAGHGREWMYKQFQRSQRDFTMMMEPVSGRTMEL